MARTEKAIRGTTLTCKSWLTEAPMRMLMHNVDPEVAEKPEELIVYGGSGRAARGWECFDAIVATLKDLEVDETLLVQSGKPVGVYRTHEEAPRVLIANSHLVPKWATWEHFNELERRGLMMFGQMTAGSWIYIGTQGILQGTYETLAALARKEYGASSLKGKIVLTGGLGGMGGAQPMSVTMNEGVCLIVEVDPDRLERRLNIGYLNEKADSLDAAVARVEEARKAREAVSVGLVANCADVLPELVRRGFRPDIVTDQTSAHDPLNGYVPHGLPYEEALALRKSDPADYERRSMASMAAHCQAILDFQKAGSVCFDYGNNLRGFALEAGVENAFDYPGFVPAYIRPLFCEGKGPFRWAALSGDPADIHASDKALTEAFPEDEALCRWIRMAAEQVPFQGLPSRICWFGQGDRARAGAILNDLVESGRASAPYVIGRDHLDTGSVASPNRETEGMRDGTDAVADWPILNALLNTASGATWVSLHHGGGVGMGYSIHAGQVTVADGTEAQRRRVERVLTNDPASGVLRHADAGYEEAIETARRTGLKAPMLDL